MELRTLRYFLATAEAESITRAADVLHVTQPTLSRQIMELEKELGATLIQRSKNGLSLTADGLLFRQRAQEIVDLANRLEDNYISRGDDVAGTVLIGSTEAVGCRIFAGLITRFSQKYPNVQFHLYNEMADNIKERLDKGLIDIGLLLDPVDTGKYDYMRFSQKETWGILLREDHPLAEKAVLTPEDLVSQPLILPLRRHARESLLSWLGQEEQDLHIPLSYTLLSNTVLLVKEGMGLAFCLDGALSIHSEPGLRFIPISPQRSTNCVLIWKKNNLFSPATSRFLQTINLARAWIES